MEPRRPLPWPGIALAIVGSLALLTLVDQPGLALAVLLLWLGSLWLTIAEPPPMPEKRQTNGFTRDGVAELVEHSGTPLLLTERNRIAIANQAAREVLGDHIVGQDVRVALRHPGAVALADQDEAANATVKNLARRGDIWRISRQPLDDTFAVIELLNRTAEADMGRAHTDFVANASHELRTPLASIIGYVETLSDESAPPDEATRARFLSIILRESRRLQGLVSDLMSLSRIEAEKHDVPSELIHLAPLVDRAARDAAGPERASRLSLHLAEGLTIQGDTQQLEQLVRNLVDNALKYGADGGTVTLTLAEEQGRNACLVVADEGEGISSEHLPHLTRRFYRTDPGRSLASGGTGLGLAIVKHIVERHRGRMNITSGRGHGTTVVVKLPTASEAS